MPVVHIMSVGCVSVASGRLVANEGGVPQLRFSQCKSTLISSVFATDLKFLVPLVRFVFLRFCNMETVDFGNINGSSL